MWKSVTILYVPRARNVIDAFLEHMGLEREEVEIEGDVIKHQSERYRLEVFDEVDDERLVDVQQWEEE